MTTTKSKYALSAWDLSELLAEPSEQEIAARMAEIEEEVRAFEKLREPLQAANLTADDVTEALRRYESILRKAWTLGYYAMLWFSADTQSTPAITLQNRMQQALTDIQNRLLFFELWWKGLDDARAAQLVPDAAVEPDYAFFLQDLRRTRPYTLDEKSEQLINLKDANGITGLMTVYSMLTNRLEFTLTINGEERKLTRDALMSYVYSPDPQMRAAAYQELYRVYGNESKVLAQIYNNRVRDWWNEQVQLRGYASPIAVRNVANDVPDAAVETLLEVVARNAPVFQRYFRLKAKWLGMEKLRRYDIYAPLTASDRTIEYGDAVELVLDTFRRFDPGVAALVQRVFDQNHIDSEVRKGKRGGAFCATVRPDVTPYVLLNYTGKVRDVATLAHELGHALHSMLAEKHSILTQHPSLPLAETASVFAEMLLTDRLLAEERDPLVRRDLLASAVDDMYATVMRQTFFVLFEKAAHQAILENASQDRLNELYMENLHRQFGDSLDIAPEFQHEWVSIPHMYHTPFYCYAYSFGQLLVLALYRRYQQEGDAFKPGYLKLLSYGGAARPERMLREAGVDMTNPDFWQGGFDVIAGMIDELEAM
ncbi:MAG: oligoendopeptidase F [Caldilinea sp.]|uniref:Peptidase M3 family protein n=2 Tax=Caldilineaceae TaxID=475964 RepID=I0I9T1_CALAS|nr:peptidase M3 family protein [Caldilinea aerophila DSM 14535 = NBRC 104270]GIV75218.1 MAG: oligoendopeptidase F [Caldilinea sp.]